MRILSLFLTCMLLQPTTLALPCDMEPETVSGHQAMHAGKHPESTTRRDCCDPVPDSDDGDCAHAPGCGACPGGAAVFADSFAGAPDWKDHPAQLRRSGLLPPSHSHPPFRPPSA